MKQERLFTAEEARDEALERVMENATPYPDRAIQQMRRLFHGNCVTGEEIRLGVELEIGSPHHHNAWGAIINKGVRSGILQPTGRYLKMKSIKSHARKTPEYEVH